ncbi:MAG: NADH-quinone oxidoreductase subunit L [Candidatus Bathyarchaeota archaeon]|nr:NADH-quinone oxidoreductase subunit L [Candidatus Bathyarchaeota archaeon]
MLREVLGEVFLLPYAPWLCWVVPITGSAVAPLLGRIHPKLRDCLPAIAVGASFVFSLSMIPDVLAGGIIDWRISWFHLQLGVLVDPLGTLMACVINGVGLLVVIFSTAYMKRDPSLARYWFLIQAFIGGLTLVVVAGDLLSLLIGWETIGVACSALVAFWHQNPENAHSGLKTFMMLRVGDALLLAAFLMIYAYSGTFSLVELQQDAGWMVKMSNSGLLLFTALTLFGGTLPKSALFPLHVWLPDALPASPASFNALTEVLGGAFLIARFLPMFHGALTEGCNEIAFFFLAVAGIGAFTALLASLMAMVQRNVIRVLVYSIISQYAYVAVGLGTAGLMIEPASGYSAASMHMMVDAISSALLFFSAASLFHATGSQDMFNMGRVREQMPVTFKCMLIGALALMGIPPLSGFWSEEAIGGTVLKLVFEAHQRGQSSLALSGLGIYVLLMAATGLTAFFTVRMMGLIFWRKTEAEEGTLEGRTVTEAPAAMLVSMAVASAVTVGIGLLAPYIIYGFRGFFSPVVYGFEGSGGIVEIIMEAFFSPSVAVTGVALVVGIVPAYRLYVSGRIDSAELIRQNWLLGKAHSFLWNRCYIDAFYYKLAHGALRISGAIYRHGEVEGIERIEFRGFNEIFNDVARGAIALSKWAYPHLELGVFEALNQKIVENATKLSDKMRQIQTGVLPYNMLLVLFGIALLAILLFLMGGFF